METISTDNLYKNWLFGPEKNDARCALYERFIFATLVKMNQPFSIFPLTVSDIDEATRFSNNNHAHSHGYEELIIGVEREAEHFIDYKTQRMSAPFISFVTSGKIHKVMPLAVNGKCTVWGLKFKSEFIPQTTFQLYSYYHENANIQVQRGTCFKRIVTIVEMMAEEMKREVVDFAVVRQLLSALLTMIESERKKSEPHSAAIQHTQSTTFKKFLILLEKHFHEHEGVEFYAERLFMTGRNLNFICHNILQRSVLEIIELRKLIEAKNLLINSEKSISEIGFEVGYQEKTHFANVFKKKPGQTPSEFRSEMRKLIS